MTRSMYKSIYISPKANGLLKILSLSNERKKEILRKRKVLAVDRSTTIIPKFLGMTFKVYNGRRFIPVLINQYMYGHKLGEFSFTKAMGIKLHKQNKEARKKAKKLLKARMDKRKKKKKVSGKGGKKKKTTKAKK